MIGLTEVITSTLLALGSGFATFIFTRAKYRSEVKHQDLLNLEKGIELYKGMVEDFKEEQLAAIQKRTSMQEQITRLQSENLELRQENYKLKTLIQDQEQRLARLEQLVNKHTRYGNKKKI